MFDIEKENTSAQYSRAKKRVLEWKSPGNKIPDPIGNKIPRL